MVQAKKISTVTIHLQPHVTSIPLHKVEAGNTILATNSIQVTVKHSYSNTGSAGTCRGNIAGPLVRLWVIPKASRKRSISRHPVQQKTSGRTDMTLHGQKFAQHG